MINIQVLQIGWLILRLIGINRVFLFKADDIMKGYITCLFMFRPLYIEIYYLCGVASSWYIIFFEKVNGLFIPSL